MNNPEVKKKKSKKPPFTEKEDAVIIECVINCTTNLSNAFFEASKILTTRTLCSIEMRWYKSIRTNPAVSAITVGSKRGFTQNVKNIHRKDGVMPEQGLKNHLYLLKEILSLPPKEREMIISILKSS